MSHNPACLALLLTLGLLVGCEPSATEATSGDALPQITVWPSLADGALRQLTKHPKDLLLNDTLAMISDFPNNRIPKSDITPIEVRRIDLSEVENRMDSARWLLVDVRKPDDAHGTGLIPGSVHYQYNFEGDENDDQRKLTKEVALQLLAEHEGLIFVCNGPKCGRSFNAAVSMVQHWGLPPTQILWFSAGVGAWKRSTLLPPEVEVDDPSRR